MDNINEEFGKYYRITTHPTQQENQQQRHPQYHHLQEQQLLLQQQHQLIQQQQQQQQQLQHQNLFNNMIPNEFYTTANPYEGLSSYKTDDDNTSPSLFMEQISTISSRPNLISAPDPSSHHPLRFTADMMDSSNNLSFDNSANRNHDNNHANNFLFTQAQQSDVIMNDSIPLFGSSSNMPNSHLPPKARKEQDVFRELISLARNKNNTPQPSDMNSWQSQVPIANSIQYSIPNFSSSSEFTLPSSNLPYSQNKNQYSIPSTITAPSVSESLSQAAASAALAKARSAVKVEESIHTSDHSNDRIYTISMAQQPSRARMCGFGDKDRRPISPSPIVKLTVTNNYGQSINPETFDVSFLVLMCDSCQQNDPVVGEESQGAPSQIVSFPATTKDDDGEEQRTAIKMRNLVGSSVSSATKLYDLDGNLGIFFVFQDVSLRNEGCFRLKFSLIDVGSPYTHTVNTSTVSHILKAIYTEPFIVYTAKKFPGVVQSTPLSKCFARQGVKIPIRKEKSVSTSFKKRQARENQANTSEDEEGEEV